MKLKKKITFFTKKNINNILFKSKSFYGGYVNKIDRNIVPFIYGKRNNTLIINLKYTIICIKKIFNLVKLNILNKKKLLIISNSRDSEFLIDEEFIKKNESIIFLNKKWINGYITNKNMNSFIKNNNINLIFIYKISNIYFTKEISKLQTPIISLIDTSHTLNNIDYPLIININNIKSLYTILYIFRKLF